jgi:hypothetical protein
MLNFNVPFSSFLHPFGYRMLHVYMETGSLQGKFSKFDTRLYTESCMLNHDVKILFTIFIIFTPVRV